MQRKYRGKTNAKKIKFLFLNFEHRQKPKKQRKFFEKLKNNFIYNEIKRKK